MRLLTMFPRVGKLSEVSMSCQLGLSRAARNACKSGLLSLFVLPLDNVHTGTYFRNLTLAAIPVCGPLRAGSGLDQARFPAGEVARPREAHACSWMCPWVTRWLALAPSVAKQLRYYPAAHSVGPRSRRKYRGPSCYTHGRNCSSRAHRRSPERTTVRTTVQLRLRAEML
jgi:hypothetical protein